MFIGGRIQKTILELSIVSKMGDDVDRKLEDAASTSDEALVSQLIGQTGQPCMVTPLWSLTSWTLAGWSPKLPTCSQQVNELLPTPKTLLLKSLKIISAVFLSFLL